VPNQDDLAEQIKAWAWTVKDVRDNGGTAETEARRIDVPSDVDIEAIYVPPEMGGPRQALDEALAAFESIKVRPVESDQANRVGEQARRLMAHWSSGPGDDSRAGPHVTELIPSKT
jgi:hypothetical protein